LPPDEGSTARPSDQPDRLETILARLDRQRALADLRKITGEEPLCLGSGCDTIIQRKTGSAGLGRVTEYMAGELQTAGYQVERDAWSTLWYSGQNLIAIKPGQIDRRILLVAHLDGVAEDEGRYPGADDDGSGVVDLLETARAIAPYTFERSVVFFFSSGEEQGSLGVKSYLQSLSQSELDQIEAVIDVDVIGYDANGDQVMQIFHGDQPTSMALAEKMQAVIIDQQLRLKPLAVKGCG
jgi:acetylornithine deacetylase/succinyl-diaminopimelate desuccinylase-like protein